MNQSANHHTDEHSKHSVTNEKTTTLKHLIEHSAHILPAQGPITVFVHHNTLHAFEDLPFEKGVVEGGRTFGCHPFLSEDRYRKKLDNERIRIEDLEAVLLDDLGENSGILIGGFGTRYALRLAMLQFPLHSGSVSELRWFIAQTDALRHFREEVDQTVRERTITTTRHWIMREFLNGDSENKQEAEQILNGLFDQFGKTSIEKWDDRKWEAFVLHFLWRVCYAGAQRASKTGHHTPQPLRHRDLLLKVSDIDTDLIVHDVLIRFCAAFLDQGISSWSLPQRNQGFYHAFFQLYADSKINPAIELEELNREIQRLNTSGTGPLESIAESLSLLGIKEDEQEEYISKSLLALRGWAGMIWQMETNAEWMPHTAPSGSLVEFLAIRLILDRLVVGYVMKNSYEYTGQLDSLRTDILSQTGNQKTCQINQRAFTIFQLAQVRGWNPNDLLHLSKVQWSTLIEEIESFSSLERRRIYHLAFERKYRNETLDAVATHSAQRRIQAVRTDPANSSSPTYQVVCCIDEREESFRRHLEEIAPECETFGVAGFFGVAMYYRGAADAHFTPLCPVNIKPTHYVQEETLYSLEQVSRRRAEARRRIGQATHQAHVGTRTFIGGFFTGLLGSLAAFPLVARILFPRSTAQVRRIFNRIVQPPGTQLRLERIDSLPGSQNVQLGYSIEEMAAIVEGVLKAIGLSQSRRFSPLVVICGHGSASLNNPHEAAHDCGACGGGRGGPNARAFAQMANDPRVRRILADRQLMIPDNSTFIGCYHNTCDDSVTWYDLDRLPVSQRTLFEKVEKDLNKARAHSAHERCRRFESAELALSVNEALRHVEGRAEDLSQTRPEYGHATNALCFVGRRQWNRGLFLDRRAFLTSYDPSLDDADSSILERTLQAVIPVCAGINLEYYFSYVDSTGYGCGTKLAHNITSLLGVMDGAASDLRPGLPLQMVEIHEPVRLLFVIETTVDAIKRIISNNQAIARLVHGNWVQLAVLDADTSQIQLYHNGHFQPYLPETDEIPSIDSSIHWYRGWRDHLGFASIREHQTSS
ncbi:MAG: DUF2309 domain-containing protein [Planctomycetaceae bacterium]|nr:DUF2309 domain-containing protein [Planctomycetaceae bacterium]